MSYYPWLFDFLFQYLDQRSVFIPIISLTLILFYNFLAFPPSNFYYQVHAIACYSTSFKIYLFISRDFVFWNRLGPLDSILRPYTTKPCFVLSIMLFNCTQDWLLGFILFLMIKIIIYRFFYSNRRLLSQSVKTLTAMQEMWARSLG